MNMRSLKFVGVLALTVGVLAVGAGTASAQLDPLLFLKRVPPTVIVVVDTSLRMLEDGQGRFYDPNEYSVAADPAVSTGLGLDLSTQVTYRRQFRRLQYENVQDASTKFFAEDILAVPNTDPGYATFYNATRLEIAKQGISQAVSHNLNVRWSLIKTRQDAPAWRVSPNCDKPVRITANGTLALLNDSNPCNAGPAGRYGIYTPTVNSANFAQASAPAGTVIVQAGAAAAAATVLTKVSYPINDARGLIPAGRGASNYHDRPVTYMLADARAEAIRAMGADAAAMRSCRNTVVVLLTSGANGGDAAYVAANDPTVLASQFTGVSGGGTTRRVPIYVVGVRPDPADEGQLQQIAENSGGVYYNAQGATGVAAMINRAVQAGFSRAGDFESGVASEFTAVSPIVGTVNLKNASAADGGLLTYTDITMPGPGGTTVPVPQRSNVMLTAGFSLPGFDGRIRAFRTYVPEPDNTRPSTYKFVADGTRLWPDLDGRPQYAGLARTPADPANRNVFTAVPNGAGGVDIVTFNAANAPALAAHLGVTPADAPALVDWIRAQPLGPVIGSTPALMDAPSLDPPPDDDYGRAGAAGTFAGDYEQRRSIIFVGANDGMIHAIDARTGYEVWAFVPYNLLPKLRALVDGQAVEQFDYFVDSSPKVAEVKITMSDGSHRWRSLLIIGQGPGGTFYQTFDVTEAGMGVAQDADGLGAVSSLLQRFDSPNESIRFMWSFPHYSSFDPSITNVLTVTDATPGGRVRVYGDLKPTASIIEKTVGFTWSDPAVGPLNSNRTVNAVMVGSGYFPAIEDALPGRGPAAPRAGRTFYLIDVEDGTLLGSPAGCGARGCIDVGDVGGLTMKNALQADPSAAGEVGSPVVTRAYMGDLDGKYWKFSFDSTGAISRTQMADTGQPIFGSSALLFVGTTNVYMFFSTGSDLLPTTSPQGTGRFKLWGLKDNAPAAGATTQFTRDLAIVSNAAGVATGERPSTAPSVAGDIVFYTTTTENGAAPCTDFTANLYAFTYLGGAAYDSASSNNNQLDRNESPLVRSVAGRATAPFIVDQHLYFGTTSASGVTLEAFGDPEDFNNGVGQVGVRVLSWREIR